MLPQVQGLEARTGSNVPNGPRESGLPTTGSLRRVNVGIQRSFFEEMALVAKIAHQQLLQRADIHSGLLNGLVAEAAEPPEVPGPCREGIGASNNPEVTSGPATEDMLIGCSNEPVFGVLAAMWHNTGPGEMLLQLLVSGSIICDCYPTLRNRIPRAYASIGRVVLTFFQGFDSRLKLIHATREARLLVAAYARATTKIVGSSMSQILDGLGIPNVDFIQVGNSICASLIDFAELVLCPPAAPATAGGQVFRMAQVSRQVKFDELIGSIRHSVRISLLGELLFCV